MDQHSSFTLVNYVEMVDVHYSNSSPRTSLMGFAIAESLLRDRKLMQSPRFAEMLEQYPNLGADVLLAAPSANYGRLWY